MGGFLSRSYGKCFRVLLFTFLDLDRITVSFDKLYNTELLLAKTWLIYSPIVENKEHLLALHSVIRPSFVL